MNKRQFIAPYILLSETGGEGGVIGGHTGQGGTHVPDDLLTYSQWQTSEWAEENWYDGDESGTINDYIFWGAESGYTWAELNAANGNTLTWQPFYADWGLHQP